MTTVLCAQNPFNYSQLITVDQGLPSNRINALELDNQGFLWIGTSAGLVRYDGAQFETFLHNDTIENSIIDNRVRDLVFDAPFLWVGTHNGVSKFNLMTGEISSYGWTRACDYANNVAESLESVHLLHRDFRGNIWVGTQHCGFGFYDRKLDSFTLVIPDTSQMDFINTGPMTQVNKARTRNAYAFVDDFHNDSILWVGAVSALIKYNKFTGEQKVIIKAHDSPKFPYNLESFADLYQDPYGLIYGVTTEKKILTYHPELDTFGYIKSEEYADILDHSITGYLSTSDTTVWITTRGGVVEYDFLNAKFLRRWTNRRDQNKSFGVHMADSLGRFYFRTEGGLKIYDPIQQQFELSSFNHLNPDMDGFVFGVKHDTIRNCYYACSRQSEALYKYELDADSWASITFPSHFLSNGAVSISDMDLTASGRYLVTTIDRLLWFDPNTEQFDEVSISLDLSVNRIQDVLVDSRNTAWINTLENGVYCWDLNTNEVTNYTFGQSILTVAGGDSETFLEDSKGRIWIKRRRFYAVYFPGRDTMMTFQPDEMHGLYNRSIVEDDFGTVWIASVNGWLGAVDVNDVESGIHKRIYPEGVRKDHSPQAIDIGPNGYIWCALAETVVRIDPVSLEQESFSFKYGEDPNEFFSFQFTHDGHMVFGKRNAIVTCNLQSLQKNTRLPIPYINNFTVQTESIALDTLANYLSAMQLKPSQNYFSLEFSSIGMGFGDESTLEYRLTPLQSEWIPAGKARQANYTNVPSGEYVFELQARNNEGMLNPTPKLLPISIRKYWYNTWFARIVFILASMGLLYTGYRFRIGQIRKEADLRNDFQQKLADVEMTALRAQMNPHFIFNSLNSIESYVIQNDTLKASTYLNDFARLIRLILQNSRSKYIPLVDEIEALQLYIEMESLRFTNKFSYQMNVAPDLDINNLEVPPMIIQPYVENAIWHGLLHKNEPGELCISITRQNGSLRCVIEDNGIGREKSQSINAARKIKRKKSMGMTITNDRIKVLNNLYNTNTEVVIEDLTGSDGKPIGTRVEVNIPI